MYDELIFLCLNLELLFFSNLALSLILVALLERIAPSSYRIPDIQLILNFNLFIINLNKSKIIYTHATFTTFHRVFTPYIVGNRWITME